MYDIETCNAWWNSMPNKAKAKIHNDRSTKAELRRNEYMPVSKNEWWTSRNWSQRSDIYQRFISVFPTNVQIPKPTKSKSKNKSKRGDKK